MRGASPLRLRQLGLLLGVKRRGRWLIDSRRLERRDGGPAADPGAAARAGRVLEDDGSATDWQRGMVRSVLADLEGMAAGG